MLQVTESAVEAVKAIVGQAEVGATGGLRIAVDETDESVELGVEETAGAEDTVIDQDGARVFLDAPAARACPPPPNAPVRTVASTPPGLVRTLTRVAAPDCLNRIATSAASACDSRSMMPSLSGRSAPVAA